MVPMQQRTRVVRMEPGWGGEACPPLSEDRPCPAPDNITCPIDCVLEQWGSWTTCSKTCDTGVRNRTRAVSRQPKWGGALCSDDRMQNETCHEVPCPVHCSVTDWSSWTQCTKSCDTGEQKRTRHVLSHPDHGGYSCPELEQVQWCNQDFCPQDCVVSKWSTWNSFVGGGALVKRTRYTRQHNLNGGVECPDLVQTRKWHDVNEENQCTPHDEFGDWSECTKRCNHGMRYRERRHILCSHSAVVKLHLRFRQGVPCNIRPCYQDEDDSHQMVQVPGLGASASAASVQGVAPSLEDLDKLPMLVAPADANLVEELVDWSREDAEGD